MEAGVVALWKYIILAVPVLAIAAIVWFNRTRRVKKFKDDPNEEGYICPICHMSNDSKNACERCGFDPKTKEGNITYDENKLNDIFNTIGRGV